MPRQYFEVAIDGADGDVVMDIPGAQTVDDHIRNMLVKPLCVLCGHCRQTAKGAFFAQQLADCEVGWRDHFIGGIEINKHPVRHDFIDDNEEEAPLVLEWFQRISASCIKFIPRD